MHLIALDPLGSFLSLKESMARGIDFETGNKDRLVFSVPQAIIVFSAKDVPGSNHVESSNMEFFPRMGRYI